MSTEKLKTAKIYDFVKELIIKKDIELLRKLVEEDKNKKQ